MATFATFSQAERVFDWFKRSSRRDDPAAAWRAAWGEAVERPSAEQLARLRAELGSLNGRVPDVEVEEEMLDALETLCTLQTDLTTTGLPIVDTRHRVIGTELCHFSAPASLPGDGSQASGRVLFTGAKAIFVGSGQNASTAWHAVHQVLRSERDLLLIRADSSPAAHYRFNTFGDALSAALLAQHLRKARTPRL